MGKEAPGREGNQGGGRRVHCGQGVQSPKWIWVEKVGQGKEAGAGCWGKYKGEEGHLICC